MRRSTFIRPTPLAGTGMNSSACIPAAASSSSSSSSSSFVPNTNTTSSTYFTVLYTARSNKKRKVFSDGVLCAHGDGKMLLYDADGKQVSQGRHQTKHGFALGKGSEINVGSLELEVQGEITSEAFMSGRAFTQGNVVVPTITTTTTTTPDFQALDKKPTSKMFVSPSMMIPTNHASNLNSSSSSSCCTTQPPMPTTTVFPTLIRSQYDPTTPNALILCPAHGDNPPVVVDPSLTHFLRPHQREGVKFMFECLTGMRKDQFKGRGCVLADDMGLGKTIQSITLIWTLLKQTSLVKRCVVCCPASLVDNWAREFTKWLGPAKINPVIVNETGAAAKKSVNLFCTSRVNPVLIISYETYRKHAEELNACQGLDLLLCDEGHRLKSVGGNKTIAALNAAPTERRVILTGTPLQNQLDEFYAIVSFVNPQALGRGAGQFKKVFQDPIEKGRDKNACRSDRDLAEARLLELSQLTSGFILRRTSEVNRAFLPPKRETTVFCRLTAHQINQYKTFTSSSDVTKLLDNSGNTCGTDALRLIHQLKQLCTHPSLVGRTDDGDGDVVNSPPTVSGIQSILMESGKLTVLDKLLSEIKHVNDRVVLVSNSTATLDLITKLCVARNHTTTRLDGSTPLKDRMGIVNRFNSPTSNIFVFLLSAKAGGCGINLIGANRLILVDPDWNPAVDAQAMARVWRDGQAKPVTVYRLLSTGTIEERIFQRQIMKNETAEGVLQIHGHHGTTTRQPNNKAVGFSRADLKALFEYRANTACDTYDLLNDVQRKTWPKYSGPHDVEGDDVLAKAAAHCGIGGISFIHSMMNSDVLQVVDDDDDEVEMESDKENDDGDDLDDDDDDIMADETTTDSLLSMSVFLKTNVVVDDDEDEDEADL